MWTHVDAAELYEIDRWGKGYFSIGDNGQVKIHPTKEPGRSIDLKQLVDHLQLRGIHLPTLIRFRDILQHRLQEIYEAFQSAITQHEYTGQYICVYPIKVNQQRQVVEEVLQFGRPFNFGLEAGSKPELLAVVALADNDTPIICNGFKDAEFIEMAMLAQKIGRQVIPVVEKYTELQLILDYAEKVGVRPTIGMRVKLAARGGGRWQSSGGYRSKFGLTVGEILQGLKELKSRGMEDCFQLLHFHLGSQIPNIRIVKGALNEAARVYVELVKAGAGLKYHGRRRRPRRRLRRLADQLRVERQLHAAGIRQRRRLPPADRVRRSEGAAPDHRVGERPGGRRAPQPAGLQRARRLRLRQWRLSHRSRRPDMEQPLIDLIETYNGLTVRNAVESYHDAQQALDMAMNLFSGGYLPLDQRSQAENLYWAICVKLQKLLQGQDEVPEDLQSLDESLSDTYFCNFSLFQSIPDSWAIKQLFPIMPIHRLNERPTQHAVLGDITCDSDGKIDQFIDRRDVKRTLPLHAFNGSPYYLGVFLVGAYQEILGDLHNLYGDTHAVHVSLDQNNAVVLDAVIKGDTVREVLDYVEFDAEELVRKLRIRRRVRGPLWSHHLRRIRPRAALLRRRAARLHLPRRAHVARTAEAAARGQ